MKKLRRRHLWFLLPVLLLLFVRIQWNTWFMNPPEPSYTIGKLPQQILLSWTGDPFTTRIVTWQGDTLSRMGSVQLVKSPEGKDTAILHANPDIIRTLGGSAAYFKATLTGLVPGSSYRYRLSNGNGWTDWKGFQLGSMADSTWSFVYFGDVQDTLSGETGKIFHRALEQQPQSSFMIFIGDVIERPHNAYWQEWFRSGGDLFATVPVIATPGNHEYYKGLVQKLDPRWGAHFPSPGNGPENFKNSIGYWDYQNTRFISLDSNGIQSPFSALEQRSWLKKVLENTKQRWIVVLMHHPPYSTSRGRNYFYLRYLFKSLFDKYHVDLVLSGHDHVYGRAAHISSDEEANRQGAVYVVSHASPKNYDIGFSPYMDRMASNTGMYQLLRVSDKQLSFKAYSSGGHCLDSLVIQKDASGQNHVSAWAGTIKDDYLNPSERFLQKSSKSQLEEFYQEREAWKKSR